MSKCIAVSASAPRKASGNCAFGTRARLSKPIDRKCRSQLRSSCRRRRASSLTHFFSRLDDLLRAVCSTDALRLRLDEEIRGGSLFEEHIKKVRMSNGQSIFDVLGGKVELPYQNPELPSELLKELRSEKFFERNRERFFFEYMRNYSRFARKFAAISERSDEA